MNTRDKVLRHLKGCLMDAETLDMKLTSLFPREENRRTRQIVLKLKESIRALELMKCNAK